MEPVRKGAVAIQRQESRAGFVADSVPDNATLFLDGNFLGVTPLRLMDLEPGRYAMEIRSAGFKPYAAKVTLRAGRTLSISRELEQERDVHEIILTGKIPPRRQGKGGWE